MPRGHRPSKKDANHNQIQQALEAAGWAVADVHEVGGILDLIISKHNITIFVEVKSKDGKLTKAEKEFVRKWKGLWFIAREPEQAVEIASAMLDKYYVTEVKE